MKIIVKSPLRGYDICSLLDGKEYGEVSFRFLGRQGINWEYGVYGADSETAAALAKGLIKAADFGKVLNFSVACG